MSTGRRFLVADLKRRTTSTNRTEYAAAAARGTVAPITFRPPPLSAYRWDGFYFEQAMEFGSQPVRDMNQGCMI